MNTQEDILLVYDGECPACNNYCQFVRIKESVGTLKLVDARQNCEVLDEVTQLGFDVDKGMLLKTGDQWFYGSDAIHVLALMSTRSGCFNRFNFWLFKSRNISGILYPILRACRNLLLKLLGKSKINNLQLPDNEKF